MSVVSEDPVVAQTLSKKKSLLNAQQIKHWGFINCLLLVFLLLDISAGVTRYFFELGDGIFWYIEFTVICIVAANCVSYLFRYMEILYSGSVALSDTQKKLLGVKGNESGFKTKPASQPSSPATIGNIISPSTFCAHSFNSVTDRSPQSSFIAQTFSSPSTSQLSRHSPHASLSPSPSPRRSPDHLPIPQSSQHHMISPLYPGRISAGHSPLSGSYLSQSSSLTTQPVINLSSHQHHSLSTTPLNASDSLLLQHGAGHTPTLSPLFRENPADSSSSIRSRFQHNTSMKSSPLAGSDEYIKDMKNYSQFLQECDEREARSQVSLIDSPGAGGQSFWSFNRSIADHSPMLRKYTYQIACKSPQSAKKKRDENDDGPSQYEADEIWTRAGVSLSLVDIWIERIRKWLGLTIMTRLVSEIETINKKLVSLGCEDMEIGEVSISVLKQLAYSKAQHLPTLHSLIPFLEVSDNQAYVVKRIRELGSTSCLADFSWQSGSDHKGKPWGEHLPSDSAIVVHIFNSYMDSRLPHNPKYPDGKTFTSQYFLKTPDKPNLEKKDNLYLYQTKVNPPHYKVVIGDDIWNLPKGRNNLFHALLLFLHHVNTKEKGMLGKVNLGMSGINVLWVVQIPGNE